MEFLLGVVASIVAGVLLEAAFGISISGALSRKIIGLKRAEKVRVIVGVPWRIVPGTDQLTRSDGLPIFGLGPMRALVRLFSLTGSAFKRQHQPPIVTSDEASHEARQDSVILLGFPLGNQVSAEALRSLNPPFVFDGHVIISETLNRRYDPEYTDGRVTTDYGYFLTSRNPFSDGGRMLLLAGCETYGVEAAARLLSRDFLAYRFGLPKLLPAVLQIGLILLLPHHFWRKNIGIIVRCSVSDHNVHDLKVVERFKF